MTKDLSYPIFNGKGEPLKRGQELKLIATGKGKSMYNEYETYIEAINPNCIYDAEGWIEYLQHELEVLCADKLFYYSRIEDFTEEIETTQWNIEVVIQDIKEIIEELEDNE